MELDFTLLEKLGKNEALNAPQSRENREEAQGHSEPNKTPQSAKQSPTEETSKYTARKLLEPYEELDEARRIISLQAQAIHDAGDLRTDLAKGINNGAEPLELLLMALKCISLMTGEEAYYTMLSAKANEVYRPKGA